MDPRYDFLHSLESDQKGLLKDLKSLNRRGRAADLIGCALVVLPAVALMDGNIAVSTGVGFMGIGLLLSVTAARYFLTAASLPASRNILLQVEREIARTREELELNHPMYADRA